MRVIFSLLTVALLLAIEVHSENEISVDKVVPREPSIIEQQFLSLHLRLDQLYLESSEQVEQIATELHLLRQSVEHLAWVIDRVDSIAQRVENNNDLLVRNITILTEQSDQIMLNQQYCANHEALKDLFFELTPKCGELPPNPQPNTTVTSSASPPTTTDWDVVYGSCSSAPSESGVYRFVRPDGLEFRAYCEQNLHDGNWMVFQSRQDGSVDFNRSWSEFRDGFGDPSGEYWLGLEHLNQLTRSFAPKLLIVMEDFEGRSEYVIYEYFWVDDENFSYRIRMNSSVVTGNAGDSLYSYFSEKFVTFDHSSASNYASCTETLSSGFWHYDCVPNVGRRNNLNGIYGLDKGRQGIWWGTFKNIGFQNNAPLKAVKMMLQN